MKVFFLGFKVTENYPSRRAEGGGRTTKGRGGRQTADGRKFLLLFSYTLFYCHQSNFKYNGILLLEEESVKYIEIPIAETSYY